LDQCPGHPDFVDTDQDGIPNGCDETVCLDENEQPMDYCEAIKGFAECVKLKAAEEGEDYKERFNDMRDISRILYCLYGGTNCSGLSGELEYDPEDYFPSQVEEPTFDISLIIDGNGNMVDTDDDQVCDLFDVCPWGDDFKDEDYDGIPDECADCITSSVVPAETWWLYIEHKFELYCTAQLTQIIETNCPPDPDDPTPTPIEITCETPGWLNCACECVPDAIADMDEDGICDELDQCPGGDDLLDWDCDGEPNACDPDDPCLGEGAPPLPECPPANMECIIGGYIQYNEAIADCECVIIPDGDDDGDGVCNSLDVCPGTSKLEEVEEGVFEIVNLTGDDDKDMDMRMS